MNYISAMTYLNLTFLFGIPETLLNTEYVSGSGFFFASHLLILIFMSTLAYIRWTFPYSIPLITD